MSLSSKQLEDEIAAMEGRLATVKVTVEIEKDAWKKVARKGKLGTKWKSAASTNGGKAGKTGAAALAVTSRSEIENLDGEIVIEPLQWDSLELAQYLQSKQLASYAKVVVHEQITGKLLLDTARAKLKVLFLELVVGKSDPNWKNFLRVCSDVHKLQKSMNSRQPEDLDVVSDREKRKARSPPKTQSSAPLFPAISPRVPAIQASALATKGPKQPPVPSLTASLSVGGGDATKRSKTSVPHAVLRKSMTGNNQPKATCWNCGALFPRAPVPPSSTARGGADLSSKHTQGVKVYCSNACRDVMESTDMSVSATMSLGVRQPSSQELHADTHESSQGHPLPKPPLHAASQLAAVIKSPRHKASGATASEGFDFLHVAHRRPPIQPSDSVDSRLPGGLSKQASNRMRIIASQGQGHYQLSHVAGSSGGSLTQVASITPVRCLPDDAIPPSLLRYAPQTHPTPRAVQQSLYKLDPEMFHATGIRWTMCFDMSMPHSPTQRQGSSNHRGVNLERLVEFLSVKAVFYLSLTCQKWCELIHALPVSSERVWGVLFRRTWQQMPEDEQCLRELGYTSGKPKKPRRLVMKLTRQVQKVAHENMKILLNADNWQLAPVCKQELDYLPISCARCGRPEPNASASPEPIDRGNDLYEVIIVILKPSGEIVAIQAQELIRPIAEDGSTIEILQGLKAGALLGVQCRRLRLFSLTNRLPVSEWYLLPEVSVLLEFCQVSQDTPPPTIWQLKVLAKLQKQMEKRLLAKESVQQIIKWTQERSMSQQAIDALEQFLLVHVPALMNSATTKSQRRHLM